MNFAGNAFLKERVVEVYMKFYFFRKQSVVYKLVIILRDALWLMLANKCPLDNGWLERRLTFTSI